MIPVKQKIIKNGNIKGDCFRACMASMLELPNDNSLPHITSPVWYFDWQRLLKKFGMSLNHDFQKIWRDGYWIASVPSLNFENITHSIIMFDHYVEFDPSLAKTYEKGRDLFQENKVVIEGYWLEVSDISKVKNLEIFRNELEFKNVQSKK